MGPNQSVWNPWSEEDLQKWEELKAKRPKHPLSGNNKFLFTEKTSEPPIREHPGKLPTSLVLHEFSDDDVEPDDLHVQTDLNPQLFCHQGTPPPRTDQGRVFVVATFYGGDRKRKRYSVPEEVGLQKRLQADISTCLDHHFRGTPEEHLPEVVGIEELRGAISKFNEDFKQKLKEREMRDQLGSEWFGYVDGLRHEKVFSESRLKRDEVRQEQKRRAGISKAMLAKRGPNVERPMTAAERKRKQRERQAEEKSKTKEESEKEALRKRTKRLQQKGERLGIEPCCNLIDGQLSGSTTTAN
jgi:hypothetical protein